MAELHNLPKGFERAPEQENITYKAAAPGANNSAPTVNFRGRPGGGPGRGMGQTVEHAENVRGTLLRLLKYFKKEKTLIILLMIAVVCVTLAGLFAPSLQGKAIDAITEKKWDTFRIFTGNLRKI